MRDDDRHHNESIVEGRFAQELRAALERLEAAISLLGAAQHGVALASARRGHTCSRGSCDCLD
jgi:hypothetical protein